MIRNVVVACVLLMAGACGEGNSGRAAIDSGNGTTATTVVDSVLPMDVMLSRFRVNIPEVKSMSSGTPTRDGLVRSVVTAMIARDTSTLQANAIKLSEWAWLYFPQSVNAHPPYELPPGLAWFKLQEGNRIAVKRAISKLADHEVTYRDYQCAPRPAIEGDNRIWTQCQVRLRLDGKPVSVKLFSSIVERDDRMAMLSYQNDF